VALDLLLAHPKAVGERFLLRVGELASDGGLRRWRGPALQEALASYRRTSPLASPNVGGLTSAPSGSVCVTVGGRRDAWIGFPSQRGRPGLNTISTEANWSEWEKAHASGKGQ
jgi:hypothetical protein